MKYSSRQKIYTILFRKIYKSVNPCIVIPAMFAFMCVSLKLYILMCCRPLLIQQLLLMVGPLRLLFHS